MDHEDHAGSQGNDDDLQDSDVRRARLAVVRELGRLAVRLGLLDGGMLDWAALAGACGVSSASLFAVMTQDGEVAKQTLYPFVDGILAVTHDLDPPYNILPLLMALGVITREEIEVTWNQWRTELIRAEFGDDPRARD